MGNHLSVFIWIKIMDIETKRLLLRPLRDEDAPAIAVGVNNFAVSKNLARVPFPYSIEAAADFIARQGEFAATKKICAIAFRCAPDEAIGVVSYEANFEFGYWLRQCCWRMGLMSEAAAALVQFGFSVEGLAQLYSSYHADNPNSGRILRKLGFVETHEAMDFSLAQGKEVPVIKLVLTRESWLAQQKGRAI
jgi:RimJ/RimL family protein N-acetyltransferase